VARAVDTPAEAAVSHYQAGLAYERLGRLNEAYTELQLACALNSEEDAMALALGVTGLRLGRYEVAQRALEHSVALNANSIASYYELALLYEKQQTADRAVESWHRFSELSQDEILNGEARKHIQFLQSNKVLSPATFSLRRVSIQNIEGDGGPEAAEELGRALAAIGLAAVNENPEAVLSASLVEYNPKRKLMISIGATPVVTANGQKVTVYNPILSLNGPLQPHSSAIGLNNPQIVAESVSIGLSARLQQLPDGKPVWADAYSYERLDLPSALQAVVRSLALSLRQTLARFLAKNPKKRTT
jgi:tetratricopeptide (TPR) repeat protein